MNHILVINGSLESASQLERLLSSSLDAEVLQVNDLTGALELIEQDQIDLVLVNAQPPQIDGLEVCDRLHQTEAGQRTPIFLLSPSQNEVLPAVRALSIGPGEIYTLPTPSSNLIVWIKVLAKFIQPLAAEKKSAECSIEDQVELYKLMLDLTGEALFLSDTSTGEIQFANAAAESLMGYSSDLLIGKALWDFVPTERQDSVRRIWSQAKDQNEAQTCEFPVVRRSGVHRDVAVSFYPQPSAEGARVIVSMKEFLDRHRHAEYADADYSLGDVREFLSALGHEVRNPLTGISTNVQYMQMAYADSETQRDIYQDIMLSISRLDLLFREIVDYTHPMDLRFEKVNINELIEDAISAERELAEEDRKYSIDSLPDVSIPKVMADRGRFRRALEILIEHGKNDIADGGVISIKTGTDGTSIKVSLSYDGKGLSARHIRLMFTPVDSLKSQGSGFGMAFAKRILDEHQCRLEVSSEQSGRTRFEITFPLTLKSNA